MPRGVAVKKLTVSEMAEDVCMTSLLTSPYQNFGRTRIAEMLLGDQLFENGHRNV